jgi:hypothetical protein
VLVERIDHRDITLRWIPSKENEADVFTKALDERLFTPLAKRILGGVSAGAASQAPVEGVC